MVLRSDAETRAAVLDELAWDTRVTATGIDASVTQGVVALTGTVPNDAERLAAEADAHHLHGVLDVVDEIEVRSADSPLAIDVAIARAARRALIEDRVLPEAHIHVTVSHALLRLDGDVDCWGSTRESRADHEATGRRVWGRQLAGVCGVVNAMEVSTSQPEPRESSHDEYRP